MNLAHSSALVAMSCLAAFMPGTSAQQPSPLVVTNAHYRLELDATNGDIVSLTSNGRELVQKGSAPRSLFSLRFRQPDAGTLEVNALDAKSFSSECVNDTPQQTVLHLDYAELSGKPVSDSIAPEAMRFWPWAAGAVLLPPAWKSTLAGTTALAMLGPAQLMTRPLPPLPWKYSRRRACSPALSVRVAERSVMPWTPCAMAH